MKKANKVTLAQVSEGFKNLDKLTRNGAKRVPTAEDIATAKGMGFDLDNPKSAMERILRYGYEQGNPRKSRAPQKGTRRPTVRTEEEQELLDCWLAEAVLLTGRRLVNGRPDTVSGVQAENCMLRKIVCGLSYVIKRS